MNLEPGRQAVAAPGGDPGLVLHQGAREADRPDAMGRGRSARRSGAGSNWTGCGTTRWTKRSRGSGSWEPTSAARPCARRLRTPALPDHQSSADALSELPRGGLPDRQRGEGTKERPYLSVRIGLEPGLVTAVLMETGLLAPPASRAIKAMAVSQLDAALLDSVVRLVRLVDAPRDYTALAPSRSAKSCTDWRSESRVAGCAKSR